MSCKWRQIIFSARLPLHTHDIELFAWSSQEQSLTITIINDRQIMMEETHLYVNTALKCTRVHHWHLPIHPVSMVITLLMSGVSEPDTGVCMNSFFPISLSNSVSSFSVYWFHSLKYYITKYLYLTASLTHIDQMGDYNGNYVNSITMHHYEMGRVVLWNAGVTLLVVVIPFSLICPVESLLCSLSIRTRLKHWQLHS
jgi:hypothetical protein